MTSEPRQADGQPEKVPWDFDDPNTPFWNDPALKSPLPRNFLTCFTTNEITQMNLDASAHLPKDEKLSILLRLIYGKLQTRETQAAPSPLYEIAWEDWQRLMVGIIHLQELSGRDEDRTKSLQLLIEHGRDGQRNLAGVSMMAAFKLEKGEYGDAEAMGREVLPWLQGHEMLGPDSPQALGCMRRLIECLWRQGKEGEAEEMLGQCRSLVGNMGGGKFGKYQEEEREGLEELVRKLKD